MQCKDTAHNWVLEKSKQDTYWVYEVKRGRFSGKLKEPVSGLLKDGKHINFANIHTWYCTKCRQFDTTIDTLAHWDDYLDDGYAIFDWRNRKMVMPTLSRKEAQDGVQSR